MEFEQWMDRILNKWKGVMSKKQDTYTSLSTLIYITTTKMDHECDTYSLFNDFIFIRIVFIYPTRIFTHLKGTHMEITGKTTVEFKPYVIYLTIQPYQTSHHILNHLFLFFFLKHKIY
jgi:hypothetical protein